MLSFLHCIILVISGIVVGFINTLAGGGTIISLSVFMMFGLPLNIANGTNRIAVFLQNLTAVGNFSRKKLIDWKKVLRLAIPIIPGSILGALMSSIIPKQLLNYIFGILIFLFALLLLFKPQKFLNEQRHLLEQSLQWWHYLLFFLIGIYGGFIHVGVGYLILGMLVLCMGNELVRANAMKNFLVLCYIPFSLVVFAIQGHVHWQYGLIHSIGNIIGAAIASNIAIKKGANVIRYIMLVLIVIVVLQLLGIIDPFVIIEWLK
jgi:uncharacterized membrane protein YfcA